MRSRQLGLSTVAAVLLVILILLLLGALPLGVPYTPYGFIIVALIIVVVLAVMGKL